MNAETIDLMRHYLTENGVRYNDSISTMVVRRNQGNRVVQTRLESGVGWFRQSRPRKRSP
jgi:hypothetical protein|nr:MAG TPA: hypothetical protein [Caudoviricetes sp.]